MRQEYNPPDLNATSLQDIFDYICGFLRTQGEKSGVLVTKPSRERTSTVDVFECRYRYESSRTGKILRCAAGCCLPEDRYSPLMENIGIDAPEITKRFFGDKFYNQDDDLKKRLNLLARMQAIHDLQEIADWESCFQKAAEHFNLEYKAP